MACRGLQAAHRLWGMVIGAGVAVVLLIVFTGIVATLMALPYLKLVGGLALLVIAAKLLVPEDEDDEVAAGTTLWHAVQIVVIADIIMSLDNVIAVAAAANGSVPLLILGLAISIPLIIAGAALIMRCSTDLPILVWLGAHAARLDRGRRDRERSGRSVRCCTACLDGHIGIELDVDADLSASSHFSLDGDLMDIACVGARRDRRAGRRLDLAAAQSCGSGTHRQRHQRARRIAERDR